MWVDFEVFGDAVFVGFGGGGEVEQSEPKATS